MGPALREPTASSWGGRSFLAEDGKYHAFFSEFGGSCGMDMWDNNSHVVHAVADEPNPSTGYTRQGIAIPAFSHCVEPVLLPDRKTWLLFHNGDGTPRACGTGGPDCDGKPLQWLANCSANGNGTTPSNDSAISALPGPAGPAGFEPHNAVHQATSPAGPWVAPSAAATDGMPQCDCPAVHALPNGSIAMWCQPLVNYAPRSGDDQPSLKDTPRLFINQGWGTPFAALSASITVPSHLLARAAEMNGWFKLDGTAVVGECLCPRSAVRVPLSAFPRRLPVLPPCPCPV